MITLIIYYKNVFGEIMYVNLKLIINKYPDKINYKKIFKSRKFIKFLNNFTLCFKSYDFNKKKIILYFPRYKFKFYKSNIKNIERNDKINQINIFFKTKLVNYSTNIKKCKNIIVEKKLINYSLEEIIDIYIENIKKYYENPNQKFKNFNNIIIEYICIID